MYLSNIKLKNYRRLSDVTVDLADDISIFVGSNNSGKTSVAHAMHFFVSGSRDRFSFHDISACRWGDIDSFEAGRDGASLPVLSIDLWFGVEQADLHRVIDLLPNLDWLGAKVGVRIAFAPRNEDETLVRFRERHSQAQEAAGVTDTSEGEDSYVAPPRSLREFLEGEIQKEYEFKYFVLDETQFDDALEPSAGYEPQELLRDQGRTGKDIVSSLIKTNFLHAQRHLSDSEGGSRSEELSRHLSRYYQRNLQRHGEDHNALKALADSEILLNQHLEQVFADTLQRLGQLGYPGLSNPRLIIKSALNPATVMNSQDGAHVHYALNDDGLTLPDKYNGLGFKNLIYMVVELLDLHAQWLATEENRPPLHLVFVEEPEAHLHAQLQQVFVNKILEILAAEDDEPNGFHTQLVLTTHSPHILYERGFQPIRYFRREGIGIEQSSKVLNLSEFYRTTENPSRDFLERYLKLTHCDIFFADAAVLVEGNVERIVMPQMIQKAAPGLRSCYLCVLEIGGAYAHLFRTLIEFLGITTLVVTDLDSVSGPASENDGVEPMEDGDDDEGPITSGSTCTPDTPDAVTSNQMLAQWLPGKKKIDELLNADAEEKTIAANAFGLGAIRVTYPCAVNIERNGEQIECAGRTLEVAFAFDNLDWTQDAANKELRLRVRAPQDLGDLVQRIHDKVHSPSYKKTDFALALLSKDPGAWNVPRYIAEGLEWLEATLGVGEQDRRRQDGES
ncbi:Predicted ATP-dependent endonuclease of the OLD family, contains P-loop ATPase and TOPRIM domains [Thalassolituus maritimus]|uniref:Predicted ATP-dependent endonuclease of the OLD family, contains P-loop ATPase and TOPRIM domains n=1 Tax=Thalassolituus maritimus TaxID=484498 RepID=A0A1N7PS64_9GAMM|nr:ATP-dependent endonuclease [Thalassolituus maritimus]SIT13299.1 Predicted ATP-dependent endonuclease of the OLD family, contains P-loop ATPase and TOPRIM domains [Thalassolituus maritimus]